ncbi:MAG: shikimate dehydrogenase [Acetobacteraceae bacterium]
MSILSGRARLAGIVGWPVAHSRSPRIHGFWLDRYAIDGAYVPLAVHPNDFTAAIQGLRAAGFAGVNVTIPHKVAAFAAYDIVDDDARRAGAVNTIIFHDDRIEGRNTDGFGFLASLRDADVNPGEGSALILGAGGGARAVAAVLLASHVPVAVANRTRARAEALARDFPGLAVIDWAERERALAHRALLVNATSLGMGGGPPALRLTHAPKSLAVVDLVYTPLETELLATARARGLRAVDGLGMLLHQARPGFEAWFGIPPAVDADLRRHVLADLDPA